MKTNLIKKLVSGMIALMVVLAVSVPDVAASTCSNHDRTYQQGLDAMDRGDYVNGVKLIGESALQGKIYMNGICVKKDIKTAAYWLATAADQGHAEAQFRVGVGYVLLKDPKKAVRWVSLSANQGYQPAIDFLNKVKSNTAF